MKKWDGKARPVWVEVVPNGNGWSLFEASAFKDNLGFSDDEGAKIIRGTLTADLPKPKAKKSRK